MATTTRFTDPVSVETWDACFRWREGDALRDVTIDDTWRRVATAVARPQRGNATWADRYVEAFSRWRLLPDERLLRCAGTGIAPETFDAPAAVLNVGAFVEAWIGAAPRFQRKAFMETAALAVRLLDDALRALPFLARNAGLRIGLVGFGDALVKLGVQYETCVAREFATVLATDLAEGCLRGAVALAEERGADAPSPGLLSRLEAQGMPVALVDAVRRHGVRHVPLTRIEPHPLLARLANGASDALDPVATPLPGMPLPAPMSSDAERAIAAAMQPWIDAPIGGIETRLAALVQAASVPPSAAPVP